MDKPIPQTPAEQQAILEDAAERLIDGDAAHNKAVLAEAVAALRAKAPEVWERIHNCPVCHGSTFGCDHCRADRLEYAALIGM